MEQSHSCTAMSTANFIIVCTPPETSLTHGYSISFVTSSPRKPLIFFFFSTDLPIKETTQYVGFCDWLISLGVFSRFMHLCHTLRSMFLLNPTPRCGSTTPAASVQLLTDAWGVCFLHISSCSSVRVGGILSVGEDMRGVWGTCAI